MPIPDCQTLLLPVLQMLADGAKHSSEEIRDQVTIQFNISSHELREKHANGTPVLHNRVAWALAHLNMGSGPLGHPNAVQKVRKEVYRITGYGKAILSRNPSELTIKEL